MKFPKADSVVNFEKKITEKMERMVLYGICLVCYEIKCYKNLCFIKSLEIQFGIVYLYDFTQLKFRSQIIFGSYVRLRM